MPTFKLKSPDYYPPEWHRAMLRLFRAMHELTPARDPEKVYEIALGQYPSQGAANIALKHSQAFRSSLRKHPMHGLHYITQKCDMRCRVEMPKFNPVTGNLGPWKLILTLRWKASDILAEVMGKNA